MKQSYGGWETPVDSKKDETTASWETMSIQDTLKKLNTSTEGLTTAEAETRVQQYGPNKLPEQKINKLILFLGFMWNPLSWAMEVAAILAIFLLDFYDFILILFLLILNACIGFFEELQAGNAVASLMDNLSPECKVLRDGSFINMPAEKLVPGDVIRVRLGDIIPADIYLLQGDMLKVDQSSLTGESLPVTKKIGDRGFSGTIVKQGEMEAIVTETGCNTVLGKAADLINSADSHGRLQDVLTTVGNFCIISIAIWCFIELIIQFGVFKNENPCILESSGCLAIENLLVLIVGGIPVAMPTVLSVTLAIGSTVLAKQSAIVTRLTCIEEMASMEVLCSDKTGTLTLNRLSVDLDNLIPYNGYRANDVLRDAALAARTENNEAIDVVCYETYPFKDTLWDDYTLLHYTPFDPITKRTIAKIKDKDGNVFHTAKGAPQVILGMTSSTQNIIADVEIRIEEFASRGYRALGVCRAECGDVEMEKLEWKMIGIVPLFDPPRHDTAETVKRAIELGVSVKMVTGDQRAIAVETCRQLGMPTNILNTSFFDEVLPPGVDLAQMIYETDGFAQVFPEHKYEIVKKLQSLGKVVGMTGDGVNDAPALKQANIGIAVDDATDAARAAADIVLVSPGLSVIITAIQGSREIFQRMKNYAMYSVSTTVRIVFTFGLISVTWNWYFPTLLIVVLAILNDGTILTISKDNVKPSATPDSWKLKEVFISSISFGLWLTVSTIVLFYIVRETDHFADFIGSENLCIPCLRRHCDNYFEKQYRSCSNESSCGTLSGSVPSGLSLSSIEAIQNFRLDVVDGYWKSYTDDLGESYDSIFEYLRPNTINHLSEDPTGTDFYDQYLYQYTMGKTIAPFGQSYSPYEAGSSGEGISFTSIHEIPLTNGLGFCNFMWDFGNFNNTWTRSYKIVGPGMQRKDSVLRGLIYMQVSISGQALIFVTRTAGTNTWFFLSKPSNLLLIAFVMAQIAASLIGAFGFNGFPTDRTALVGCGGGYTLIAWLWTIGWHIPLDFIKFSVNYFIKYKKHLYNRLAFTASFNPGHPSMTHSRVSSRARSIRASRNLFH